jgi:mannose-1-phosphate guanylyltransferase
MYQAVIMAGGSGTRLWPLSREAHPKQALRLVGEQSMFQHAVDRLSPLFAPEQVFVVTRAAHAEQLHAQAPQLPAENFIVEPEGRGTAPAIGLAAIHLYRRDPGAVMAVLTADHFISNAGRFRQVLAAGENVAQAGHLVTLGIQPSHPSTGFGYIEQGQSLGDAGGFPVFRVRRFTEKPDTETAARMVAGSDHSWNSGMFIWQVTRILEEFATQMPDFYAQLQEVAAALGSAAYPQVIERIWPQVTKQTIDYGVMERAQDVAVIPVEMGWTDVGSWGSLVDLLPADAAGNILVGSHLDIDTRNTLVFGGQRLVATIGVEDLIIVDAGDALLVCHKDHEQQVKQVVESLKALGRQDLL